MKLIITTALTLLLLASGVCAEDWNGGYHTLGPQGAVAEVYISSNLNNGWVYHSSVTFCEHGEATYNAVPAGNLQLTKMVLTNNGIIGPIYGTNYSTNLTGWAKIPIPTGQTPFCNPFDSWNDYITNVCRYFPTGVCVVATTTGNSNYSTNYNDPSSGWSDPNARIIHGRGYYVINTNSAFDWCVFGEVSIKQTLNTPSGNYSFRGSRVPKAGYIMDIGFDNDDDDAVSVHIWSGSSWVECQWDENDGWQSITGYNISAEKGPWISVGQAVLIEKHGSANPTWTQPGVQ